jgi:hypothetical protein
MPLSIDRPIVLDAKIRQIKLPVAASAVLFLGAAASFAPASGYIRPATNAEGEIFAGFVFWNRADNSNGGDGDAQAVIVTDGVAEVPITEIAQADIGKSVYAADDATFTITQASNEPRVGFVESLIDDRSGYARVRFTGCQRIVE